MLSPKSTIAMSPLPVPRAPVARCGSAAHGTLPALRAAVAFGAAVAPLRSRGTRRGVASEIDLHRLQELNGLPQIELYTVTDAAAMAAEIFQDAGFVLLPGAVDPALCGRLAQACREEETEMLLRDEKEDGNRGAGRYSLGEAQKTGHLLHRGEWAELVDLPQVTPVLQRIFGGSYVCAGAGGDFVRPGVSEYQALHVDLNFPGCHEARAAPVVTLNVAVEPLTWRNGPTRIIPGTHRLKEGWSPERWEPPGELEEPQDWRYFTFCPLPAGTAILRDNRAWHGGTPNLSQQTRFLPNVEFAAAWWCQGSTESLWRNPWKLAPRCMPRNTWRRLSPYAQHICRMVVTDKDLDYGVRDGFSYRRG